MTGPEHYAAAEELLASAGSTAYPEAPDVVAAVARAQVHATLALTAATIDATYGEPSSPSIEGWGNAIHPEGTSA